MADCPETPVEIAAVINSGFLAVTDRGPLEVRPAPPNVAEGIRRYRMGLLALVEADDATVAEALEMVMPDAMPSLLALAVSGLRARDYSDLIVARD